MMLGRHAEDLFWAGRYLERVQVIARLLDVSYHWSISSPMSEPGSHWRSVSAVLSLDLDDSADERAVLRHTILDESNDGAIFTLLNQGRENVRRVRELLSSELWEAVNDAWLRLNERNIRFEVEQHPSPLLSAVKTQCQTIAGVASETMPRDDALRFLQLGSHLERAAFTCRVVDVYARPLLGSATPLGEWLHVLRTCAGAEAYLRKGGAGLPETDVVRFLLLEATFPRSVAYSVGECAAHVDGLDPSGESRPARLLGRLLAEIRYADLDEWIDGDLGVVVDELHSRILDVSGAIAQRFFGRGELDPYQIQMFSSGGSMRR